jgi:hypothetical protein
MNKGKFIHYKQKQPCGQSCPQGGVIALSALSFLFLQPHHPNRSSIGPIFRPIFWRNALGKSAARIAEML